ncbi:hypothetical protein IQ251_05350 [Saccharopolyspora sp. HNM0983]|uniref:Uncharacterized protein n=1 Tax=Saccharopolyspora montiporae TaxID=2781240 RepID=A0A929BA80_9PSEU|nr:hypothetical protein [Saccharopolyspora sp. HNM0983]MBE9373872.1 hypothetical protein [Saccharopolyspora sp. HNM0983]
MTDQSQTETTEGHGARVLGLVTDPDMSTQVGSRLADGLTEWLGEQTGEEWTVEVVSDPVTAGEAESQRILNAVQEYLSARSWTLAICVTDLPLLLHRRALVADASTTRRVGVISLPALGALRTYGRTRDMLHDLLRSLLALENSATGRAPARELFNRLSSVQPSSPPGDDVDVRYTDSKFRGWLRLVSGMVRANRPSTLIFGLSGALTAAVATSAFGLSSSTIWQIGDQLPVLRQAIASVGAVGLLVGWLIGAHGLWEKVRHHERGHRRLVPLYNTSTVATLTIGVGVMYIGLFLVNVGVAWFLVGPSLLAQTLGHSVGWSTYLSLAWGFTTMGMIAGALGSSLESDRAVRQAAYGYREQQRRSSADEENPRTAEES